MKFQLLLVLALLFTFSFDAMAVKSVVADVEGTSLTVEKENITIFKKIGNWFKQKQLKAATWVVKKMAAMDFNDPGTVIKLAIILILGGIVLYIVGWFVPFVSWVGYLASLAGAILFWYWVYLKFIK